MTKTIELKSKKKKSNKSRLEIVKESRKKLLTKNRKGHNKINGDVGRKVAKVALLFIAVFLMGLLGSSIYAFNWLQNLNENLPSPDAAFPTPPVSTLIYDRTGGVQLYKVIGDFNSDNVDIEKIPELVRWPFLAAEDVDFFTHEGFDTAGILRCSVNYVKDGGNNLCGGSTITQQLIKITALSEETSKVTRKIKELFMSTKVEQKYSKEEILGMYLTVVPFGSNIVGIETAADYYFDKEPQDLNLAQAALLSAIIQNPSYLSPTKPVDGDMEASRASVKERQLYVLGQLESKMDGINEQIRENAIAKAEKEDREFKEEEVGYLTTEMIEEARNFELVYQPPVATDKLAGHFVDFVYKELITKNYKNGEPFTPEDLQNGGYKVITTLDYELQKIAEEYAAKGGNDYQYWNSHNAAIMTMTPSNGEIITMAGSKSFTSDKECPEGYTVDQECWFTPEVNIITSRQSPGSTNKVQAYMMAYDKGLLFPGSLLPDIPISFGGYIPKNWDGGFKGIHNNAKEMLRQSRNIPALIVIQMIGVEEYIKTAQSFGYTTYTEDQDLGPSVVLGGTTVYPLEHAGAFGVYANQGDYVAPSAILRIEDREGNIVYEHKPERRNVASAQATYLVNQSLYNLDNFSWDGRDVALKTGTSEENIDSWMMVYSPDFVTVGWTGNNNNEPLDPYYGYPIFVVKPWLQEYMSRIGESSYFSAKTPFSRPGYVTQGGGCNEKGECVGVQGDWMIQGKDYPITVYKRKFKTCVDQADRLARDIDIALGFAKDAEIFEYKMPAAELQGFLDEYMRNSKQLNGVPTAYCDIDRTGGVIGPVFNMVSPLQGTQVQSTINVKGTVATTQGNIDSLRFYINNKEIGSTTSFSNFDLNIDISAHGFGGDSYTFKAIATDTSGLSNTYSTTIFIGDTTTLPSANFTQVPSGNLTYGVNVGPGNGHTIAVKTTGKFNEVNLYQVKNGTPEFVGTMDKTSGDTYTLSWGGSIPAETAQYYFYVIGITNSGVTIRSEDSASVNVNQ
jgi:penicillin-binding protein 1A